MLLYIKKKNLFCRKCSFLCVLNNISIFRYIVSLIALSQISFISNASTGVSSLDFFTIPIYVIAILVISIILVCNYYLYKKIKKKGVWFIAPIILISIYIFIQSQYWKYPE